VVIALAGGPDWASIMTAFGTVGATAAALWIALWSDRRSDRRIKDEHDRADARLADERRLAREREQLAEAYAVQVVLGQRDAGGEPDLYGQMDGSVQQLVVLVVNRGSFTITGVDARFSYDGASHVAYRQYERVPGFASMPDRLRAGWNWAPEQAMRGVLTPWDLGIRFESDEVHVQHLKGPYPLVRWVDRWGTRWEHRLGEVRQVGDGQEWAP
jgi:hypothetical protein